MHVDETQLGDALDGNTDAITAILGVFGPLIRKRARHIDRRNVEDLEQVGREAVWRCLRRYTGTTVAEFVAYADKSLTGAMMSVCCDMRYPDIGSGTSRMWISALKHSAGDLAEAERLAMSGALGWKMRPEAVRAVREAGRPAELLTEDLTAQVPAERSNGAEATLRLLLRGLGSQQRTVIQMAYGIGEYARMSDSEIAAELRIPVSHVSSARSKAMRRLREDGLGAWLYR